MWLVVGIARGKNNQPTSKANKTPKQQQQKKPQRFSVKTSTEKTRLSVENNPAHPPTHPLLFQAVSAANFSLQKNSDTHYAPGLCNCQYQKTKVRWKAVNKRLSELTVIVEESAASNHFSLDGRFPAKYICHLLKCLIGQSYPYQCWQVKWIY